MNTLYAADPESGVLLPVTYRSTESVFRSARRSTQLLYGKKVLEIGAGLSRIGIDSRHVVEHYVGVDLAPQSSGSTVTARAENLPFPDETFDLIIASFSLPRWLLRGGQATDFISECDRVSERYRADIIITPGEVRNMSAADQHLQVELNDEFTRAVDSLCKGSWSLVEPENRHITTHLKR